MERGRVQGLEGRWRGVLQGLEGSPERYTKSISRDEGGRLNQGAGVVVFPRAELPHSTAGTPRPPPPRRPQDFHDPSPLPGTPRE